MKPRPRIELNPSQAGLNAAFAGLSMAGLPDGPATSAEPAPGAAPKIKRGRVILPRETAHRGGKADLIAHDFPPPIPLDEIGALAKRLRAACGCGGTIRDREI